MSKYYVIALLILNQNINNDGLHCAFSLGFYTCSMINIFIISFKNTYCLSIMWQSHNYKLIITLAVLKKKEKMNKSGFF